MAKINEVEVSQFNYSEQSSAPATPSTGSVVTYAVSGKLYAKDDAGTQYTLTEDSTSPLGSKGDIYTYSTEDTALTMTTEVDYRLVSYPSTDTGMKWAVGPRKIALANSTTVSIATSSSLSRSVSVLANELDIMRIEINPSSTAIDSYKIEFWGTTSHSTATLYARLTSTGSTSFAAGDTLRAPSGGGFAPIAWYLDGSTSKEIHFKISNTSTVEASSFVVNIDYRPTARG